MSERPNPDTHRLDDQIAAFTDHLMNQGAPDATESMQDDDKEMSGYYQLLIRLSEMTPHQQPDQEMVARVRSRLESEWKIANKDIAAGTTQKTSTISRTSSRYKSSRRRQSSTIRLALVAMAIVVLLAFFVTPTVNHAFPGAAGGQMDIFVFLGLIGLFLVFASWWYFHRKG